MAIRNHKICFGSLLVTLFSLDVLWFLIIRTFCRKIKIKYSWFLIDDPFSPFLRNRFSDFSQFCYPIMGIKRKPLVKFFFSLLTLFSPSYLSWFLIDISPFCDSLFTTLLLAFYFSKIFFLLCRFSIFFCL